MEKRPIQVDGEPWEQKKCHLDILYHGQVPMLTHPVTEMQEAMGVMADSLEWAKTSGLIDERQYQLILSQYQTRMRNLHKTVRPRTGPIANNKSLTQHPHRQQTQQRDNYPQSDFIYALMKWL